MVAVGVSESFVPNESVALCSPTEVGAYSSEIDADSFGGTVGSGLTAARSNREALGPLIDRLLMASGLPPVLLMVRSRVVTEPFC